MCNDHFRMCSEAGFDTTRFPLPENDIALPIATADPLSVWGEAYLSCIARDHMPSESFVSCLPEIVRAVHQDLIIKRLGSEVFFWRGNKKALMTDKTLEPYRDILLGCNVTAGMECM